MQFVHESLNTAAIIEQFIDGRELYVGVVGNQRLEVFPVWEMSFAQMPDNRWRIATERVKWSTKYQKRYGIMTDAATLDAELAFRVQRIAKRTYRALDLNGYARIDLRMDDQGRILYSRRTPIRTSPTARTLPSRQKCQAASARPNDLLLDRILTLGLRWEPERTGDDHSTGLRGCPHRRGPGTTHAAFHAIAGDLPCVFGGSDHEADLIAAELAV